MPAAAATLQAPPHHEVPFAGHPSVGTAHAVLAAICLISHQNLRSSVGNFG
jgi:predicted PhzF superfamily epimerase YddE/YHI9